jgi:hypothetical protein
MIDMSTYFRIKNDFVSLEKYSGSFKDIDYIEGAIVLSVNNVSILSLETWDYVDQMWGYVVNGLECIISGQNYFTYFPDQPIGLSFEILKNDMIKVGVDYKGGAYSVISKNEFVTSVCSKAREFFQKMLELVPVYKKSWINYLDKIKKIERNLGEQ